MASLHLPVGFVACLLAILTSEPVLAAQPRVVAYCAQDQVYAEPIFQQFEKQTGIKVLALYDNEAVKTVGLANRLVAERGHPVCDVFWGNEEMRTRQLEAQGVFRQTNAWASLGYRSRRIVINTKQVAAESAPRSLFELTNSAWHGKIALAYPQFGTTATYFHVLRQQWGDRVWEEWCEGLAANKPLLVDGNSEVVKAVGRGEVQAGVTDSDDIADGQREGLPVAPLPMTSETLLIPNTVAVVRGAPHPAQAQELFLFLQSSNVVDKLIESKALEGSSSSFTNSLRVDWAAVLRDLKLTTAKLSRIFLK